MTAFTWTRTGGNEWTVTRKNDRTPSDVAWLASGPHNALGTPEYAARMANDLRNVTDADLAAWNARPWNSQVSMSGDGMARYRGTGEGPLSGAINDVVRFIFGAWL